MCRQTGAAEQFFVVLRRCPRSIGLTCARPGCGIMDAQQQVCLFAFVPPGVWLAGAGAGVKGSELLWPVCVCVCVCVCVQYTHTHTHTHCQDLSLECTVEDESAPMKSLDRHCLAGVHPHAQRTDLVKVVRAGVGGNSAKSVPEYMSHKYTIHGHHREIFWESVPASDRA